MGIIHRLPPEPDPAINNSTILGIDSNNNGVRDDVERRIFKTYQAESIKTELMLSGAKIHQKIVTNPVGHAIENQKLISKFISCEMYLSNLNIEVIDSVEFLENAMYNTKDRVKNYLEYNQTLSGGSYGSGPADWTAEACDFDIEQLLKDRK